LLKAFTNKNRGETTNIRIRHSNGTRVWIGASVSVISSLGLHNIYNFVSCGHVSVTEEKNSTSLSFMDVVKGY
jgi:hypothetical protein